jgi:predicted Zn-dependent peptidase
MKYNKKVLPNGLRLLTIPMPSLESVTVLVMVNAGSRYETKNISGIAHFLEHMAFKGTQKRPSAIDISSIVDGMGGECNAFTSKESVGYYIKSASTRMETSIDLLSDMLLNSKLDSEEINKEKGVIIEEINMYEDLPMRKIGDIYEELLYGDTPLGWDIAGNKDIINSITREDFVSYISQLYSADNMTVVIAGGFDEAKAISQVEQYFGAMKQFKTKDFEKIAEKQSKPAMLIRTKQTEQIHVALGFRTVSLHDQKKYPLSVLAAILGGGMSSRLFHEVREKRGLAYYVRTHQDEYADAGTLVSTAGVDPKRAVEAVKVMMDEYRKVATGNMQLADEELRKAKEYLKGHMVLDLEDSRSVAGFYAHQELLEDEVENPAEILAQLEAVTKADVENVGKEFFKNEGLNLALIGNFEDRQKLDELIKL